MVLFDTATSVNAGDCVMVSVLRVDHGISHKVVAAYLARSCRSVCIGVTVY